MKDTVRQESATSVSKTAFHEVTSSCHLFSLFLVALRLQRHSLHHKQHDLHRVGFHCTTLILHILRERVDLRSPNETCARGSGPKRLGGSVDADLPQWSGSAWNLCGKRRGCHIVQRRCPTPRRGRFRKECPVRCRGERRCLGLRTYLIHENPRSSGRRSSAWPSTRTFTEKSVSSNSAATCWEYTRVPRPPGPLL